RQGAARRSDRTLARDQDSSIFSLHRPDGAVGKAKNSARMSDRSPARSDVPGDLGVEEGLCAQKVSPGGARSIHSNARVVFAVDLLPRWRAQAVPGIAHLVVVDLGRIVRGVKAERLDVEPSDGAEQRIGGDHAVPLRADQPRARGREVLLGVEDLK